MASQGGEGGTATVIIATSSGPASSLHVLPMQCGWHRDTHQPPTPGALQLLHPASLQPKPGSDSEYTTATQHNGVVGLHHHGAADSCTWGNAPLIPTNKLTTSHGSLEKQAKNLGRSWEVETLWG